MAGHAGRFLGVFLGVARAFQRRGDRAALAANLPAADGAAAAHKERRRERSWGVPVDPVVSKTSFVPPATPVTKKGGETENKTERKTKKNAKTLIGKVRFTSS